MNFKFTAFPFLKTVRLLLREVNSDDVEAIFELRSNKKINRLITRKTPENLEETEEFITICHQEFKNENRIFWAIEFDGKMIGTIVYHKIAIEKNYAEVGYELNPKYHKNGFMSEAMKSVLEFGLKEMNLKTIEAFTHKNNNASIALLKKHNFVFQQERRDEGFENNRIFKLAVSKNESSLTLKL